MKKSILLLAVSIALAVSDSRGSAQDPVPRTGTGAVGRYQAVASVMDGRLYVLDTATGQVWSRAPGGEWRDEGNPTRAKGRRLERRDKPSAPTLELPEKLVEMTIIQREERAIPGSDGSVRIRLGDITEGQVLLEVVTADGDRLLESTSVRPGDKVEFAVSKKKYVLHIKELRNILIGDDFGKITVSAAAEKSSSKEGRSPEQKR